MRRPALFFVVAGLALGLAAESVMFGFRDVGGWVPDLAVGWTLVGSGAVALARRPDSRTGALLAAAGLAWFAPNLASVDLEPIASLADLSFNIHRGVLIHCLLSFPTGRLTNIVERVAVAAGYIAVTIPVLAGDLVVQAILGGGLVVVATWRVAVSFGPTRRARAWALPVAAAVGLGLVGFALARYGISGSDADAATLLAYQVVLCGVAIGLVTGLLREPWKADTVTDLVVELGDQRTWSIRDALAQALGDPSLQVGYTMDGVDGYVDARGEQIRIREPVGGRTVTPIRVDGRELGVLVHDPTLLDDPGLVRSIAEAAGLVAWNARLQAELRKQIGEVQASQRRLVEAEDEERRRIQALLRDSTDDRLRAVAARLERIRDADDGPVDGEVLRRTAQAAAQVDRTLDDLRQLAHGLHPTALREGLAAALIDLGSAAPLEVEVDAAPTDLSPALASAAYFLCSEAVANVVKHARATRAKLSVWVRGRQLVIEVRDDGVGGADPAMGSGLRGLRDRIEALGGRFTVESGPETGTRLTAEIPLDGEA